ncbi:cytochrome P450 [Polyporus arcularius HHB13444]|uniref:Cytochrome P450 n=1 Tax=Polyporus arcularius HHB13444 TaxID=1314778 RepID=A0A5C3PVT2_9APHY|nr:cytochrome P450 [Polyporus arcularius HHB13444]
MDFCSLPLPHLLAAFAGLLLASALWSSIRWRRRSRGLPLPPGPPRLPIVGNLFNHPRTARRLAYHELSSRYGDVLYFKVLGSSIVVLDSARAVKEFLEKKPANSSDRVQNPMIELSGSNLNLGFLPYGQWWRRHRRAFWQHFNREASTMYWPAQRDVVHQFLGKLLRDSSRLMEHVRYTSSGAIMKVVYDIDAADEDDRYIAALEAALEGPIQSLVPGTFLVDFLPFLRYIPTWFPGATSQRLFAKWQAAAETLKNLPYDHVEAAMKASEEAPRSIIGKLITQITAYERRTRLEEEEIAKNIGAVSLEAGSDTTTHTLLAIFPAMAMHPRVLKKAQAELDAVVGPDRLPDFSDQESLVYVNAVVKELLRWHSVLPLGIPHCTMEDDTLDGYFVPAGTVILTNVWACMRDPEMYEEPEEFRPERFIRDGKLDPTVRDPATIAFGFGRRICPGRYFAQAGLFITIASLLHVFDITPALDDQGRPIQLEHGMTEGLTAQPDDLRCTIKPRSTQAEALILAHARSTSGHLTRDNEV